MSRQSSPRKHAILSDLCDALEQIAPTSLAQSWDNVGLLAGDPAARVRRVLLCIDLTAAVVAEARKTKADLILAYHPPIFKPIPSIRADAAGPEATVFECIANSIAVYSAHTALDAADGGTNDVLASLCGIKETEPIEFVDDPEVDECKLVVFVPASEVESVADAIFEAGGGRIGDYSHCSYRIAGTGTFRGGESTNPVIGKRGRLETIDEIRLESVVPSAKLPAVVSAMIAANTYDEPAFDIYPLRSKPTRGIGRIGHLPRAVTLTSLARKLKKATGATCVQTVGAPDSLVDRAIILVGAAGDLPIRAARTVGKSKRSPRDVIITGEIRHHDALTIARKGACAIALGHWASERPVLSSLSHRIEQAIENVKCSVSKADCDPFGVV